MADAAFIAIETDYEYISKQLTDRTMRFMMDFNRIGGMLHGDILFIAKELEETSKNIAEQQGLRDTGNLIQGIKAYVFSGVIELRSTAYRIPMAGAKYYDKDGNIQQYESRTFRRYRKIGDDGRYLGDNRIHSIGITPKQRNPDWVPKSVQTYIYPQNSILKGTMGGYGLLRKGHVNAANVNHNIQYYGGHVEFGHRDRGGGFVEARPYLRPALRIVAGASTGQLEATMAMMLTGAGTTFDGYRQPGLMFGKKLPEADISGYIGKAINPKNKDSIEKYGSEYITKHNAGTFFANPHHRYYFQREYSVRHSNGGWNNAFHKNDMNWGSKRRTLNWAKLGGHGDVYVGGKRVHYTQEDIMKYSRGVSQRPWGTRKRRAPAGREYYLKNNNGKLTWADRPISKRQNVYPKAGSNTKTKNFYKLSAFERKKVMGYAKAHKNSIRVKNRSKSMNKAFKQMEYKRNINRLKNNARRHQEMRMQRKFGRIFTNKNNEISKLKEEIRVYQNSKKMQSDFLPGPFDKFNKAGLSTEAFLKSAEDYQIEYAKGIERYSEYSQNYNKKLSEMKNRLKNLGG